MIAGGLHWDVGTVPRLGKEQFHRGLRAAIAGRAVVTLVRQIHHHRVDCVSEMQPFLYMR
jgi:hypothetical protein